MTLFQDQGFQKVKEFFPPFFSLFLRNYFTLRAQNDPSLDGDEQAPNSHCVYGDPAFDMVMAMVGKDIGKVVGKKLLPQYSYARIYKNGSVLERHDDRPECQYSVTACLGGEYEKNWPLCIKDYDGKDHSIELEEGDLLVYSGCELEHWRDKFEGKLQYQLFMHYVDSEGEFKDRLFDGRPNLGLEKR